MRIVEGTADLSGVDIGVLNSKMRANLLVAYSAFNELIDVGIENAGVVAETINDLKDFLVKAKEFAKNYKGGEADAKKAEEYEKYAQRAEELILKSKAIPESIKFELNSAIAASKPAWEFYKSGKTCSGILPAGKGMSNMEIADDCGNLKTLIDSEMDALAKASENIVVNQSGSKNMICGCDGLIDDIGSSDKDCKEVVNKVEMVRSAIKSGKLTSTVDLSIQGQVSIGDVCFSDLQVISINGNLDPTKYQVNTESINFNNKLLFNITESDNRASKVELLRKYLFEEELAPQKSGFADKLTPELLKVIFPKIKQDRVDELLPYLNEYLKKFNMNSCEERIMFFTQIAEETDNLSLLTEEESGWASSSSKYKGRGMFQLTGSSNYKKFQEYCKKLGDDVDFENNPEEVANNPKYVVLSAFWFWDINNCKNYCKSLTEDNMLKIAKITNCGSINSNCSHNDEPQPCPSCKPNGWERRKVEYERLKKAFPCK